MIHRALRILQVSTYDTSGGAEKVASNLFRSYRAGGYDSSLAVGHKLGIDPDVLLVPNHKRRVRQPRLLSEDHSGSQSPTLHGGTVAWLSAFADAIAEPCRGFARYCGIEDFSFPGTWNLLNLSPKPPDIIHCHNLHGRYFDLRALPWLS